MTTLAARKPYTASNPPDFISPHSAAQTTYSQAIADEIISRTAEGETLAAICRSPGMPKTSAVLSWADAIPSWGQAYARARIMGFDQMANEIISIADDLQEDPNSRRIRVDARKWALAKLRPDKYGDRVAVEHSLGESVADTLRRRRAQLAPSAVEAATSAAIEVVAERVAENEAAYTEDAPAVQVAPRPRAKRIAKSETVAVTPVGTPLPVDIRSGE